MGATYKLETLGATLRIVDEATGGDVAILGRADDPKVREFGEFAVQALSAHELMGHRLDNWQRRAQES